MKITKYFDTPKEYSSANCEFSFKYQSWGIATLYVDYVYQVPVQSVINSGSCLLHNFLDTN